MTRRAGDSIKGTGPWSWKWSWAWVENWVLRRPEVVFRHHWEAAGDAQQECPIKMSVRWGSRVQGCRGGILSFPRWGPCGWSSSYKESIQVLL